MNFQGAVQTVFPDKACYKSGLQALPRQHRPLIRPENPRHLAGSVFLDQCLPEGASKWDYLIGYQPEPEKRCIYFVEVHPAKIEEILGKLRALKTWLDTQGAPLHRWASQAEEYWWVPTGKAYPVDSPQYKQLVKSKIKTGRRVLLRCL